MRASAPGHTLGDVSLIDFVRQFREWMATNEEALRPLFEITSDFDERVMLARELRRVLCENQWGLVGWPLEFGGQGGTIMHRGVVYDELFRAGWSGPTIFEHIEIIAPTLVRYASAEFAAKVLPDFLNGSRAWSQGFSESEAGSDLAGLRTRAERDGDSYVINGVKIWTSWAKYADWCLVLARTGTPAQRHRGLTMIAVDLTSPGVSVRPITQANGTDELAEVAFEDVRVPADQVVGDVGAGWSVAMYLLAHERGTLSWLKQGSFRQQIASSTKLMREHHDRELGDVVLQTIGVRAAAANLLARVASGTKLGPDAAFNKLLMTRTEQNLCNLLRDVDGVRIATPMESQEDVLLQQEYLFSRIVTIYGGSQQMQLITVARHILGLTDG